MRNKNFLKDKFSEFVEIIKSIGISEIEKGNVAEDPIKQAQKVLDFIRENVEDFPNPENDTTH